MNYNYKIPIIPQNLDKHETIIEISQAFQYLSDVTDALFSQVNKKMEKEQKKIASLSDRITIVSTKINELKGSKTATQVFSSSKYPASEVNQDYVSIFHDCPEIEYKTYPIKYKNFHSNHETLEKLQLYHVNVTQSLQGKKLEGIPTEKVNFVNNIHLNNSGKNLYKKYETNEALRNSYNSNNNNDDNISKIDEAPHSISDRANLSKSFTQDYMYAPQIGEVPALEVPLDLPDLPGVADNLHYENDLGPAIAPSAFIESLSSLPTVESNEIEPITIPENLSIPPPPPPNYINNSTSGLPQLPDELPKPAVITTNQQIDLPKPPVELPQPPPENTMGNTQTFQNVTNPPVKQSSQEEPREEPLPKPPLPSNDLRSSLMEAIRNAGGSGKAKLRSVMSQEEKAEASNTMQGGDLMADLHKKLFMRRKGISGIKKPEENTIDPNSALGKISAMIPSPEKTNVESTSNDEEDWE